MHRAQRPTSLIMDIEDIRVSLERLSPRYHGNDDDDYPYGGATGNPRGDTHQIEINIENFVATFKKTCPDWESRLTDVTVAGWPLDQNENAASDSLVTSTDSACLTSDSSGASRGRNETQGSTSSSTNSTRSSTYSSSGGSTSSSISSSRVEFRASSSHQNLLMICGPEFINMPATNIDHYLLNPDYVMGESGCSLTVLDVADVLQARYALISGGKSRIGCPIITFPDNPNAPEISDDQYKAVVNYLTSIPTLQEVDLGFALIVDRRKGSWGAVKTMLLRISGAFPGLVQEVFVLRPSGFLQRTYTDVSFKLVKDEFKFKVLMCAGLDDLHREVAPDQLTEDLGGSISYSHHEWIQQRAAIEKFSANTSHIGQTLRSLCRRLAEVEFPNDVPSTEALIEEHEQEWKEVKEDLTSTIKHGEVLLSCFKCVRGEDGEEQILPSTLLPPSKLAHVTAVERWYNRHGNVVAVSLWVCLSLTFFRMMRDIEEVLSTMLHKTMGLVLAVILGTLLWKVFRLLVQLEETERNFDEFWGQHETRLQQCLQLRKFEEDFKQEQYFVERQIKMLESMSDDADSLSRVETLLQELADFEEETKEGLARAEKLRETGEQLIEDDHYAVDCIRPKCIELQRMCEQYKEMVRARYDVLTKSRDLHERIDKANRWCTRGVDILANQSTEKGNTPGGAEEALAELEDFLRSADDLRLNEPREVRALFESMITPESRATVQMVLKRIEDVQTMCTKRRELLQRQIAKANRPVQPVVPEPATPLHRRRPSSPTAGQDHRQQKASATGGGVRRDSSANRIAGGRVEIIRDGNISDSSGSLETDGAESPGPRDLEPVTLQDTENLPAKRGHVMRELIETERIYVSELRSILEGYADLLDSEELEVPQNLINKRNILFGNMDDLYEFHSKIFLKDLENCRNTPAMVGKCFVTRREEFQMYSIYCQNKQKSEALHREVGGENPFFKECQKRLSHRLPLGAYLLKPVQRITKYQLLLKEMLRYTQDPAERSDLQEALDTMLSVLKYVNDIMHQVGITGFNGNISDAGRLLMQGSFNVWTAHKKDKIRDLRFKPMQRHLFLYEKLLMFCKKKNDPQHIEKAAYIFKNSLDTASIGLTENVKGDKKKFEVWLRGRAEVYICQAPNEPTKALWVKEIKKVLFNQFDQLKDKHKKDIPTIPVSTSAEPVAYSGATTCNIQPLAGGQSQHHQQHQHNNNNPPPGDLSREDSLPESRSADQFSDDMGWSSDEFEDQNPLNFFSPEQELALQAEYVALADYNSVDTGEVSVKEGDFVQVLKVGNEGWWYVHLLSSGEEGWAPASYLECVKRRSSHSTFSVSSSESGGGLGLRNNVNRSSFNSNMSSSDTRGEETLV